MQKNLLIVFSFVLCMMNNGIYGSEFSILYKAAAVTGIGIMFGAGNYAAKQNEEYHNQEKRPDWQMRLSKALGAATILIATDFIANDTTDTKFNLMKLGAFSLSLLAISDTAGRFVRKVPILGGILSDPIDKNGSEIKDSGTFMRGLLVYAPLRLMISKWFSPYAYI